jgi:putative endonuclease
MTGFVYVLGSDAPGGYRTYVGWTIDLDRRLAQHNSGTGTGAKSTRGRVWCVSMRQRQKAQEMLPAVRLQSTLS